MNGEVLDYERIPRIEFVCMNIVLHAASILRKQWRTYLWWGWLPLLAVVTGIVLLSVDKPLAGSGVLSLAVWMAVPFRVNVYRQILLGERGGHPSTQLFAGRMAEHQGETHVRSAG